MKNKNKKEISLEFKDGSVYAKHIPQGAKVVVNYPTETVELPLARKHEASCVITLESDFNNLRVIDLAGARLVVVHEGKEQVWE